MEPSGTAQAPSSSSRRFGAKPTAHPVPDTRSPPADGDTCSCGRTGIRFHVLGRSDDMFIVRGVNVFPLAVAAIVNEFRPDLTGEFRIRP